MTYKEVASYFEEIIKCADYVDASYTDCVKVEAIRTAVKALRGITLAHIKVDFSEEDKRRLIEEFVEKMKEYQSTLIDFNEVGRTCKNVGTDYAECDQFVCSKCGIELQDWHSVERCDDGEVIFHEYTFRYCPNCGRKIEVDE